MKLVDLLVKELPDRGGWPEGALNATQDKDGEVCFSAGAVPEFGCAAWEGGDWCGSEFHTIRASDYTTAIITREQYESALAASKAVVGHDGWIQWAGGDCPVDSDAIVELKYRWHNQHQYSNDRAGDFDWAHTGSSCDIIAYRLQHPGIDSRANDDRLEQDLNECIGQDVDMTEWNGEGLPPVGVKCEFTHGPYSVEAGELTGIIPKVGEVVEVVAHRLTSDNNPVAVVYWDDNGAGRSACFVEECFRPLRTEAERKREAAAKEMARHANSDQHRKFNAGLRNCLSIYDAIAAGKIPGVKLEEK